VRRLPAGDSEGGYENVGVEDRFQRLGKLHKPENFLANHEVQR